MLSRRHSTRASESGRLPGNEICSSRRTFQCTRYMGILLFCHKLSLMADVYCRCVHALHKKWYSFRYKLYVLWLIYYLCRSAKFTKRCGVFLCLTGFIFSLLTLYMPSLLNAFMAHSAGSGFAALLHAASCAICSRNTRFTLSLD